MGTLEAAGRGGSSGGGLEGRRLLSEVGAVQLAQTFALLASDTRLRLLTALARAGELCVKDLAEAVGMRASAVCNQLLRLEDRGVVRSRRDGNYVFYRVDDPCVLQLIELGACLTLDAAEHTGTTRDTTQEGHAR